MRTPNPNAENNPRWKYIGDDCFEVTTNEGDVITAWLKIVPSEEQLNQQQ